MKTILYALLAVLLTATACTQKTADATDMPTAAQITGLWRSSGVDILGWEFEANGRYRAGTEEGTYAVNGKSLVLSRETTAGIKAVKTETYEIVEYKPDLLVVQQGDNVRTFRKETPKQ